MYFFDIDDYYTSGFIGVNSVDQSLYGNWGNTLITYSDTRAAFVKSINSYYSARTSDKPTSVCQRCDQIKTELINSFTTDPRLSAFWDNAENNNMVNLTKQQYDDYQAALDYQMCLFKDLMKCLDNSDFSAVTYDVQPPVYLDAGQLEFMDNLDYMPTSTELETLWITGSSCNYSSLDDLRPYTIGVNMGDGDQEFRTFREDLWLKLDEVIEGMYLGFKKSDFSPINYEFNPTNVYYTDAFYKTNMRRIKHTWWSKASTYNEWSTVPYPIHGVPLSVLLSGAEDFKYLSAVPNISDLPTTASKGDLICVGTPTSFVGYAWDPNLNSWSTDLYDFIGGTIGPIRREQKDKAVSAKRNMLRSIKPFLWANEYVLSDVNRNYHLSDVSGYTVQKLTEIVASNGASLPPKYTITASTYTLSGFTATTIICK